MPTPNFNFPTINQSDTANVPRDMNALATALDTAFGQTEYQTATVVGRQIRVTKPSASNRIFFWLTNSINGGTAIRISTDAGTTSVALTDINGENVTQMDKGFAEIVKVGNFFILRNRGMSASNLQALITITNEAEANESVLRENYIAAVNGADPSINLPSTALWNDILMEIPNIKSSSRKFASGSVTSSNSTLNFQGVSSSYTVDFYYSQVTGLTFTPKTIVLNAKTSSQTQSSTTLYQKEYLNDYYTPTAKVFATNQGTISLSSYNFRADVSNAYVNSSGFRLPTLHASTQYEWYAFS